MLLELKTIKKIPFKREPRYKPIHAECQFVTGEAWMTQELPQQSECRFNQKHVVLTGALDLFELREMLATKPVTVTLHDCDEYTAAGVAD